MKWLERISNSLRKLGAVPSKPYIPYFPVSIDQQELCQQIAEFLKLSIDDVRRYYEVYQALHIQHQYQQRFGERKTLCFEEAFVLYVLIQRFPPKIVVEIGTQYGKSTRRILDILKSSHSNAPVICFDVLNQVKYFTPSEAEVIVKDVTDTVRQEVFEKYQSGLLYLDARPYSLLKNVIRTSLEYPGWIVTVHDCSRGICNPAMSLRKDDPNVTSETGVWERHVLADVFGIRHPLDTHLDDLLTSTHHLKVFDTPPGLAAILPK